MKIDLTKGFRVIPKTRNSINMGGSIGVFKPVATESGPSADALLMETGDYLLLETGDYILKES